jgi:hypothetical protein
MWRIVLPRRTRQLGGGIETGMEDRKQVEAALREWLRGHHGVIGRSEALQLAATDGIIRSKLDRGEWERVHFGVYRDAAAPSTHYQELRAAYVATAGHASASHASAAWLWGLLAHPPARPELTVLAPAQRDHFRRNQLQRNGWVVLVYTWRDVVNESSRVGREIADTYRRLAGPTEAAALIPAPASPR